MIGRADKTDSMLTEARSRDASFSPFILIFGVDRFGQISWSTVLPK